MLLVSKAFSLQFKAIHPATLSPFLTLTPMSTKIATTTQLIVMKVV